MTSLGYDPTFTGETTACMRVGEQAFVMLVSRERLAEVANLPTTNTLALPCFSVSSRDGVDAVSAAVIAAIFEKHDMTLLGPPLSAD